MFKKIFEKIRMVNKEYLLLFFVVITIGVMIYSTTAKSQSPQEITFTTFYPCPFGEFDTVRASRFISFLNTARFFDPNGESDIEGLRVFDAIVCGIVRGVAGTYNINFTSGDARLNNLTVNLLRMTNPGPTSQRNGGKFVYDLAEGIKMTDCAPGDVVIIDENSDMGLIKSSVKFDTRVAGIVSTDPKIYMGAEEGKLPLALTGIVKCNVTAENGQIKRGDLLVSSSQAGYAMRADAKQIKPGMLVGKALQALEKDKDQIFVLVNKQ